MKDETKQCSGYDPKVPRSVAEVYGSELAGDATDCKSCGRSVVEHLNSPAQPTTEIEKVVEELVESIANYPQRFHIRAALHHLIPVIKREAYARCQEIARQHSDGSKGKAYEIAAAIEKEKESL